MGDFPSESDLVVLIQLFDRLEGGGVLGDEGTLLEENENIRQVFLPRELLHIIEELIPRDPRERVPDPAQEKGQRTTTSAVRTTNLAVMFVVRLIWPSPSASPLYSSWEEVLFFSVSVMTRKEGRRSESHSRHWKKHALLIFLGGMGLSETIQIHPHMMPHKVFSSIPGGRMGHGTTIYRKGTYSRPLDGEPLMIKRCGEEAVSIRGGCGALHTAEAFRIPEPPGPGRTTRACYHEQA